MKVSVPESWKAEVGGEFAKPYFHELGAFVDDERAKFPGRVYPPEKDVFAAFQLTPFDQVKVLLLGQDPYFNVGQAHGLCFSVRANVKAPPSLNNIFKELKADVGCAVPNNGFLACWAKQGVLMLNTILTVRDGKALSHKGRGWERFTDLVITRVNAKPGPVVFVLWGAPAHKKIALIDTGRHVIVKGAHPSPLSQAKPPFLGSRPFSAVNNALATAGQAPVDWRIPDVAPPA